MQNRNLFIGSFLVLSAATLSVAQSLPAAMTPSATTAATVIPALIRYSGVAQPVGKSSAFVTFFIFKDEHGGEPLWTETQNVSFDTSGHYEIYLGSTHTSGLPLDLFGNGEARWLEVQVAGEKQQPRVLLASVPYAMKAVDAATLGGLPASAFALAGSNTTFVQSAAGASPDASTTVTTPGGTTGYLPVFSGTTAIDDSILFESGTKIGIDTKSPASTLDVNGAITSRGALTLESTGVATSSAPKDSQPIDLMASAWNSSTKKAVNPTFALQSEAAGNNTSAPSGTLNLLYGNGATPAETGLSISNKGIIKFANGQTFPGSAGSGTITGVKAGTDLTGGGTTGAVTLNLDTTKVPTLAGNSVFTGTVTVNNKQSSAYAVSSNTTGTDAVSVVGTATGGGGIGVAGEGSGTNGIGVEGITTNGGILGVAGAYEGTGTGFGVEGVITKTYQGAGVLGATRDAPSQTYQNYDQSASAGVWGDASTGSTYNIGVFGTTDSGIGGYFISATSYAGRFESGTTDTTVFIDNNASVANGADPMLLVAHGQGGSCVIDALGNLGCNGEISGVNSTQAGTRQVETYAMQSAESWLEDAGTAQLHSGITHVELEPVFSQTVNAGLEYHVFLTPNGDCKGLYVSEKLASGFDVHELGGGTSSIAFDYRIMAKRIGHENERLVDVTERMKKQLADDAKMRTIPGVKPSPRNAFPKLGLLGNAGLLSR